MPEDEGYKIGFKELYELVMGLDKKLDSFHLTQADHGRRIQTLEETAKRKGEHSFQVLIAYVVAFIGVAGTAVSAFIH